MAGGEDSPSGGGGENNEFIEKLIRELPAMAAQTRQEYHRVLEEQRKKKEIEIGLVGRLIGDVEPRVRVALVALTMFSALLLIVLIGLVIVLVRTGEAPNLLATIVTGLLSLITGALGYIVGDLQARAPSQERNGAAPEKAEQA